jgi:hypothetical protein
MRKFPPLILMLCAGCAAPPQVPPAAAPPPPRAAVSLPHEAWEVVSSRLEVRVYRDGPMQQLGHNHVITSDAIGGTIELRDPPPQTGFTLELPLASLVVDDPAARAGAGAEFVAPVPERDRAGTVRNMLGPGVLDAARQPVLHLTADGVSGGPAEYTARVRVGLRGEERVFDVPLTVSFEGDRLRIHASVRLHHADLGLVPFSVALGALRVRDDIEVDCRLEARRAT